MDDLTVYDETIGQRQETLQVRFLEVLRDMPIIEFACKKSGIGRTTYYRWRKEDIGFAQASNEALRHGIEFINDMSESQMIQLIKERKMPAIAMWLKNNSARYGASRSTQVPVLSAPELTDDEARLFRKALALSGGTKLNYGKSIKHKRIAVHSR
jgi:hypothetical protein